MSSTSAWVSLESFGTDARNTQIFWTRSGDSTSTRIAIICYHRCLFHTPVDLLWGEIRITSSFRLDWTRWLDATHSTLFATALAALAGDFGGLGISDAAKFGLCIASSVSLLQIAHCSAERPGSGTKPRDGSAWSRSNLLHLVTTSSCLSRLVCERFSSNSLGPARHFSVSWQIKFRAIP